MKLNSQSTLVTRIPDNANYVSRGETKIPSKEIALKLLFSFEPIDFQVRLFFLFLFELGHDLGEVNITGLFGYCEFLLLYSDLTLFQ